MTIAIKTKTHKPFPPSFEGFIKMEVIGYTKHPRTDTYQLNIEDYCYVDSERKGWDSEGNEIMVPYEKILYKYPVRAVILDAEKVGMLGSAVSVDLCDKSKLGENMDEVFREGLLLLTQMECNDPNEKGRYFTKAEDWEIVR